eukprot:CAMPEP_0170479756 /NCGR_PEP_ID=MMETSP0208-20121228/872_1 /TAXON_ID=197538 /ORGANISM="Strombidium inclinatum, Strain S3" /LENGTH=112 /DNA_ID=CAMNT_0010752209 /DNA_START=217 /DNA_END=555 /DNA_ORIENTATION=-
MQGSQMSASDVGWINEISFRSHKESKEKRDLERAENLIYLNFRRKIKYWSYFCLLLAAYVLLNVFIGFSSAPFYTQSTNCNQFDPEPKCEDLEYKVNRLYILESLFGIVALV